MKKGLLSLFVLMSAPALAAPSAEIVQLQNQVKQIEIRLGNMERSLIELREKQAAGVPLNQSTLSLAEIMDWTTKGLEEIYTYDYKNYNQVLIAIKRLFTPMGYESYIKALNDSKNLQAVQEKKLTVTATVAGEGVVLQEGDVKGTYTWQIQMPILVTYQSATETIKQNLTISVQLVRVPEAQSVKGIAIHSITAKAGA